VARRTNRTSLPAGAPPRSVNAREFLERRIGPLTFARMLRSIRLCDEMSLTAFAAKLRVSRACLSEIEGQRRCVGAARAARWARVLGYVEAEFVELALQAELDAAGLLYRVKLEPRTAANGRAEVRGRAPVRPRRSSGGRV
jgi:plasmid maintenance system antidote protein VapI